MLVVRVMLCLCCSWEQLCRHMRLRLHLPGHLMLPLRVCPPTPYPEVPARVAGLSWLEPTYPACTFSCLPCRPDAPCNAGGGAAVQPGWPGARCAGAVRPRTDQALQPVHAQHQLLQPVAGKWGHGWAVVCVYKCLVSVGCDWYAARWFAAQCPSLKCTWHRPASFPAVHTLPWTTEPQEGQELCQLVHRERAPGAAVRSVHSTEHRGGAVGSEHRR